MYCSLRGDCGEAGADAASAVDAVLLIIYKIQIHIHKKDKNVFGVFGVFQPTLQELHMLSSVTLNCQVIIVMPF